MFGILSSALNAFLGFIFKTVIIKFVVFFTLFFVVQELTAVLVSNLLPSGDGGLTGALGGLSSGMWYFLDLMAFSVGFPMVLSAWVTGFIIRRLPVIG